jgi:predicted nucleic acid-binding protein
MAVRLTNKLIGFDSNVFIYYYNEHPEFGLIAKYILDMLSRKKARAVTSVLTLAEILSIKAEVDELSLMKAHILDTPDLSLEEVSQEIALEAGRIRRIYGFRMPDAVQLATALDARVDMFITNDRQLKSFKEVPVVLLTELK